MSAFCQTFRLRSIRCRVRTWPAVAIALLVSAAACHASQKTDIETRRNERERMVFDRLTATGIPERIALLFRQVPREMFVVENETGVAYNDIRLTSGPDRINWPPSDLAKLITMADVAQFDNVLILGAMGGYLESLVRLTPAFVTTVDADCGYVSTAEKVTDRFIDLAKISSKGAVQFHCKKPFELDKELKPADTEKGPGFDRIIVPYSVDWIPGQWIDLLRPSGRIVVLVGTPTSGRLMIGDLQSTGLIWRRGPDMYMPRLDNTVPNNFYSQFAGDFSEPLIWPAPTAVAVAPKPEPAVAKGEAKVEPTDSDDVADENPDGLGDALKSLGGTRGGLERKLADAVPETEPLSLDARVEPAEVAAGKSVRITVKFQRADSHVKVPKYPSAYIKLDAQPELGVADGTKIKVLEITRAEADSKALGTTYYDEIPPIRGEIKVPAGTKGGSYRLEGTVFYFYCTSADNAGYCANRKQKVVFAVDVK